MTKLPLPMEYKELLLLQEQIWELTLMLHKNGVISKEQATKMLDMCRRKDNKKK